MHNHKILSMRKFYKQYILVRAIAEDEKPIRQQLLDRKFVQQAELDVFDARQKLREEAITLAKAKADAEKVKVFQYKNCQYTTAEIKEILNLSETIESTFTKLRKNRKITEKAYKLVLAIKSDHDNVRQQLLNEKFVQQADFGEFDARQQAIAQAKAAGKPGRKARAKAQFKVQK